MLTLDRSRSFEREEAFSSSRNRLRLPAIANSRRLSAMGRTSRIVTLGIACAIAAGCGMPAGSDYVRIIRGSARAGIHFPALDRELKGDGALTLEHAVLALPKAQKHDCASDDGPIYQLLFKRSDTITTNAMLDGSGCRRVHLGGGDDRDTTEAWWTDLASALGHSSSEPLFPAPEKESPSPRR